MSSLAFEIWDIQIDNNIANAYKIATEAQALQDRMAALYEDMGGILNRYFDIKEISDPLPDRDKDGNLTNPLEIEKRKLVQQSKEMTAKAEKADGFAAKQPFLKKRQQIQMKIKDINRRLGR